MFNKDVWRKQWILALVSLCPFLPNLAQATSYTAPPSTAPITLNDADTLTINSGTSMATPSGNSTAFSVNLLQDATVTINGTLSYAGSYPNASTIYSFRSNSATQTFIINGTLNSGTGNFALYSQANSSVGDNITLQSTGIINGNIYITSTPTVNSYFGGAYLNGALTLKDVPASSMIVGQDSLGGALSNSQFINTGGITGLLSLSVKNSSSVTLNTPSVIEAIQIDANSSLTTAGITSLGLGTGIFKNDGNATISGNITMGGAFTASGITTFTKPVSIYNSSYSITGTQVTIIYDVLSYATVTLANVGVTNLNNYSVSYQGGYFPAGTYTLFTAQTPITQTPNFIYPGNSRYINFFDLQKSPTQPNTITISMSRTPYQSYISVDPEQSIGANLEYIGSINQSPSVVTVLDAIEATTTNNALFTALEQFVPIITPSIYALMIQNDGMEQSELRLADLRNETRNYIAGDLDRNDYIWMRPFGAYGNQREQQDTFGYYASTGGLAFGMDQRFTDYFITGLGFAYAGSHVRDRRNSNTFTNIYTYQALWYGTFDLCPSTYLDFVVSGLKNRYRGTRMLNVNGLILNAAANYNNAQYSAEGIVGHIIECNRCVITPEVSAQYTFIKNYSYNEKNALVANLNVSHQNSNILQLGLGGKFARTYDYRCYLFAPQVHAYAYYSPINGIQDTVFTFLDGGGPMVANFNNTRLSYKVGTAFTLLYYDDVELKLNYDYVFQQHYSGYNVYLNIRCRLGCM